MKLRLKTQLKTVLWRGAAASLFVAVAGVTAYSFRGDGEARRYREAFLAKPREGVELVAGDFHPARAVAGRCVDCHLLIDRPGFESEPQPFRTHPRLSLIGGALSPHPVGTMSCTACHGGSPHGVRHEGMRPAALTEASCRSCHRDTPLLPGAPRWDAAMLVLKATGCHSCHRHTPWEGMRQPGPSLKRVATKLSRGWVTAWLRDPRSVTAHARMPRPAFQDDAELASVVEYLFTSAEPAPTEAAPPPGNAERGKELVKTLGCLGCHGIDDFPTAGGRYRSAPDLSAVGAKVSLGWLAAWLRKPSHVDPLTTMPDFRLSETERNDIVAYLATKKGAAPVTTVGATGDRERGKEAIARLACYGCHQIRGFENMPPPGKELPRLTERLSAAELDRKHAALFSYRFDGEEAALVAPALHSLTVPTGKARSEGLTVLRRYDCQACHAVEGLFVPGSEDDEKWRLLVEARVLAHFSDDETLGPPPLVTEGARVHREWARGFLKSPGTVALRPALKARMPTFPLTAQETEELLGYWDANAFRPAAAAPEMDETRRRAAEALVARLQCLTCHTKEPLPRGTPVEGSKGLAPAFSQMPGRLRREWVIRFLKSPAKLVPGTRMPGFWPGGGFNPAQDILGGDDDAQIEALADYLLAPVTARR